MPANRISGITVEIGADNKPFNRAISEINTHIKTTASELKDVERLLKLDPKNTELLAQRQKLLAQSVEQTKSKLDAMKEAETKLNAQLKDGTITQKEYTAQTDLLKREIFSAEKSLEKLKTASEQSNAAINKIVQTANKVSDVTGKLAEATKGMSVAAAGALAALGAAAVKAGQSADDINTLSKQTGLATDTIQRFTYASDIIDVSLETLTGSMAKLTRNMASAQRGTGTAKEAFDALGISIMDSEGVLRDNEDVLEDTIDALAAIEGEAQRDAYAMQIFGKSAQELNPLILGGSEALRELGDEAEEAGLILSQEALDGANEFNDAIDSLKATSKGTFQEVGTDLARMLVPAMNKLGEAAKDVLQWIRSLDERQLKFIGTILAMTAAASPALKIVSKMSGGIGTLTTKIIGAATSSSIYTGTITAQTIATGVAEKAQDKLNKALAANPYGIAVVAITALVGAIAALAIKASKGSEEYQKLTETARESAGVMKDISAEFEDSTINAESSANAAHQLVDILKTLEAQGVNTEAEQQNYNDTLAELKEFMPDLNTEIDKNTGLLKVNTDVLHANIDALKEQYIAAAFIKQRNDALAAASEAETALLKAQMKVNETTTKQNAVFEQLSSATGVSVERIRELINELGINGDLLYSNLGLTQEQIGQYEHLAFEAINLSYALSEESRAVQVNTDAVSNQNIAVDEAQSSLDLYNSQLEAAAGGTGNLAASTDTMVQTIVPLYEQLMGELDALETSYKESYTAAYEAISGEIGLFNNMSGTATTSVNSMITALDSQIAYMDEYAANMEAAIALGVDQGLIAQLNDGSQESAAILAGIVADGGANVDELNAKLQEVSKGKTDFAEEMAEMSTDFDAKMLQIQTQMGQTVEQMNRADEAGTAARQTVQGYLSGFSARLSEMYKMGRQLGAEVMRGYNEAVDINSPSKEAAWSMGMTIDGFVNQAYREMSKLYQVGSDMGASILAGFNGAGSMSMSPSAMTAPVLQSVVSGGRAYGGGHSNANSGGQTINQTNYFSNYQNRDGAAAVRDLNRKLGRLYI